MVIIQVSCSENIVAQHAKIKKLFLSVKKIKQPIKKLRR
jgi:hypothetical protein